LPPRCSKSYCLAFEELTSNLVLHPSLPFASAIGHSALAQNSITFTPIMNKTLQTDCCIAGGGPAGVMLGFLLARKGLNVVVLEKHADFFRDFRGDTIHPSTLELMYELGLLEEFLKIPHQALPQIKMSFGPNDIGIADFSHLPRHCQYIAFMPQWDFLSFLAAQGKKYPGFNLLMGAEVTDLITEGDIVKGLMVKTADGPLEVRASLVVGADGRASIVRQKAGLIVKEFGVPIDVLWLHIPKGPETRDQALGYFQGNKMMILIDRHDYFQCGYIIVKGDFEPIKKRGLEAFQADLVSLAPFLSPYVNAVNNWDDVKLLTVQINRLQTWYRNGLLCIGDAAHAMSPAGGVGINLAVQDAVAAANILAAPLKSNTVTVATLKQVQQRRELPARLIQALQAFIHNQLLNPQKGGQGNKIVWITSLVKHFPFLSRIPARVIGMGLRPEHIRD
jgi:2-polyprenyl-6-methoxyphenol hydroxylase-like FAD-dependent oxidoreductase